MPDNVGFEYLQEKQKMRRKGRGKIIQFLEGEYRDEHSLNFIHTVIYF